MSKKKGGTKLDQSKPVALIVGAGDYIGSAIAKRFATGGLRCVGRRNFDKFSFS